VLGVNRSVAGVYSACPLLIRLRKPLHSDGGFSLKSAGIAVRVMLPLQLSVASAGASICGGRNGK
jgi:hypothetical protein